MNGRQMREVESLFWACAEGKPELASRRLLGMSTAQLKTAAIGAYRTWVCAINLLDPSVGKEVMKVLAEDEKEATDAVGVEGSSGIVGDSNSVVGDGGGLAGPDLAQFGKVVEGPEALRALYASGMVPLGEEVSDDSNTN